MGGPKSDTPYELGWPKPHQTRCELGSCIGDEVEFHTSYLSLSLFLVLARSNTIEAQDFLASLGGGLVVVAKEEGEDLVAKEAVGGAEAASHQGWFCAASTTGCPGPESNAPCHTQTRVTSKTLTAPHHHVTLEIFQIFRTIGSDTTC